MGIADAFLYNPSVFVLMCALNKLIKKTSGFHSCVGCASLGFKYW